MALSYDALELMYHHASTEDPPPSIEENVASVSASLGEEIDLKEATAKLNELLAHKGRPSNKIHELTK